MCCDTLTWIIRCILHYIPALQDMVLLITWVALVNILICLGGILSAEVVVRLVDESLTSVPQNITHQVTKLDLSMNEISFLDNSSFHLFKEMTSINVNYNPVKKIWNGTFDNNLLLKEFLCFACDLKILPSSFGPAMNKITILNMEHAVSDTGILTSPYFDGFTSLEELDVSYNNVYDIDSIKIPPSIKILHLRGNRLVRFPNVSAHRFPALTKLYLNFNDLTNISDATLAGMNSMMEVLGFMDNNLVEFGDVTVMKSLRVLYLAGNKLETIPDMLGVFPRLWVLTIEHNTRMTCDFRMCWKRLWDRVRTPITRSDDVQCTAPPAARGHDLSLISPGFMQCDQGDA